MIFLPMLTKYRNDRGLNEYIPAVFKRMVDEELQEVLDAKTWNHRIEEMCDVCVLCFNALGQGACVYPSSDYSIDMLYNVDCAVGASQIRLRAESVIIDDIISFMRWCITLNGYDFELAMIETCKKILSRTGEMNHETGKWQKHKVQANPYKPNYENCKL